jgi:hypothetical protein
MAKKKPNPKAEFVMYDVLYDDGSRTSNRRVPTSLLGGRDEEAEVKAFLAQQDREIAQMSGRPRGDIKQVTRSPVR